MAFNYERVVKGFAMLIRVAINGKEVVIKPSELKQPSEFSEDNKTFEVNRNFYIENAKAELQRHRKPDYINQEVAMAILDRRVRDLSLRRGYRRVTTRSNPIACGVSTEAAETMGKRVLRAAPAP